MYGLGHVASSHPCSSAQGSSSREVHLRARWPAEREGRAGLLGSPGAGNSCVLAIRLVESMHVEWCMAVDCDSHSRLTRFLSKTVEWCMAVDCDSHSRLARFLSKTVEWCMAIDCGSHSCLTRFLSRTNYIMPVTGNRCQQLQHHPVPRSPMLCVGKPDCLHMSQCHKQV